MKLEPATDPSSTTGSTDTLLSTTTTSLKATGDNSDQDDPHRSCPTLIERDRVREYLEKNPQERSDKDIQFLLDFMQHMPAFSNMTMSMKRSLCRVMVFAVVEKAGTVVLQDKEKLDSWSVILNGHVEVTKPDGTIQHLHMGDSFGVSSTKDTMLHEGVMTTKSDDCQFVCIPQEDFYDILHKEKENIIRIQDVSGEVVMVMEKREYKERESFVQGEVVLRGTPEMLMRQLMEENTMDETYVSDFLLTYRTFMKSPLQLADFLMSCLHCSNQLDKAFDVMHTWTVNHLVDFESNADLFARLEKFVDVLREQKLFDHVSTLQKSCSDRAQMRQVLVVLKNDEEPLQFVLVGGQERNSKIFVRQVDDKSPASKAGLRIGDQIISVNNHNLEGITLEKAYEFLKMTNHLMLTVRSNLYEFEQLRTKSSTTTSPTIRTASQSPSDLSLPTPQRQMDITAIKRQQNFDTNTTHFHVKEADCNFSSSDSVSSPQKGNRRADQSPLQTSKLRQALGKMNLIQKSENWENYQGSRASISSASCILDSSSVSSWNQSVDLFRSKPALLFSPNCNKLSSDEISAIVIYRADQSCKYILVKKSTTVQEVIEAVLAEFEISDSPSHFSLCQVTVDEDGTMKTKHLPNHINDLSDKCTFNSRYYLRDTRHMERLIQGDLASILQADINFLQLPFNEVACQLTQRDMNLFCGIDPVEYVNDLFEIAPIPQLTRFSELVNEEMFWVVTEVCSEPNCLKRSKMLKHFIRIAEKCQKLKNFNSMFAILSGLGHGSVARLRQTWDKLPEKYHKLFEEMQGIMDPSRNMLKYRNLLLSSSPPLIPFFPLVKKDLTFIHFGNDSRMDGLINFDKLRMIAKEIRLIFRIASNSKFPAMENLISSSSNSSLISVSTTPAKKTSSSISVSSVTSLNAKKVYEEGQTARMVKTYIANLKIISNENKLSSMSLSCEPNGKSKKSVSSSASSVLSQPVCTSEIVGPRFGSESPTSIRKLMSLSQAVKPLPLSIPPHHHHHLLDNKPAAKTKKSTKHRLAPIPLSQESSSVTNFSPKRSSVFRIFKDSKGVKASNNLPPPISSASSVSSLSSSSTGSSSSSGRQTLLPLAASSLAPSTEQPTSSSSSTTVPAPAGDLAASSVQLSSTNLKTVNRSSSTSSGIYSMASASSLHHHQDVIHLDDDVEADVDDDVDDISDQSVTGSSCPDDLQLVCGSADRIFDSDMEGTLKHSNTSTLVHKRHSVDGNFFFDASPSPNGGPPGNSFSSDNCTDHSNVPTQGSIGLFDPKLITESTSQSLRNIPSINKHSPLPYKRHQQVSHVQHNQQHQQVSNVQHNQQQQVSHVHHNQQQQQVSHVQHKQQLHNNTQQSKGLQQTIHIPNSPNLMSTSVKLPSYTDVIARKQHGSSSSSSSSSSSPRLIYRQQEPYQQLKQHLQSQYHQPQLHNPVQAVSFKDNSLHLHSQCCCCSVCIKSSYRHLSRCREYCWQQKMLNDDYNHMPQHLSTNFSDIQQSSSSNQHQLFLRQQHSQQFFHQLPPNNTRLSVPFQKGFSPILLKNGERSPGQAIPEGRFKYLPYQTIQGGINNDDDELVTLV